MRPEPVQPVKPEENDAARFELIKAMGVAIAAIAKEKAVFITEAEVKKTTDDFMELTIKCVVPEDKNAGDKYNKDMRQYWADHEKWETDLYCDKFGFNQEQYTEARSAYNQYCRDTNYSDRITKMKWFELNYSFSEA